MPIGERASFAEQSLSLCHLIRLLCGYAHRLKMGVGIRIKYK